MIDKMIVQALKHKLDEFTKAKGGSSDRVQDMVYLAKEIVEIEMIIADYERSNLMMIDDEGKCAPLFPPEEQKLDVIGDCGYCRESNTIYLIHGKLFIIDRRLHIDGDSTEIFYCPKCGNKL